MIWIKIMGGLGNQMFQYALYLSYLKKGKKVRLDTTSIPYVIKRQGRCSLLEAFDIQDLNAIRAFHFGKLCWPLSHFISFHSLIEFIYGSHCIYEEPQVGFFREEFANVDSGYLSGYWQSEKFFENCTDEVRKAFAFKTNAIPETCNDMIKRIRNAECPVSVHVRLGDYTLAQNAFLGNVCTKDYYSNAISYVLKENPNATFFVFSNDITNAKGLINYENCVYVDVNGESTGWVDMYMMSLCKHNIIANSTFSWWGAWLNSHPAKMVIAPQKWFNDRPKTDIIPSDWIRV